MTPIFSFLAWAGASPARNAPTTRRLAMRTQLRRLRPDRVMVALLWDDAFADGLARAITDGALRVVKAGSRHGEAAVGLGGDVPGERGVVGGRVGVAMEALQRLGVDDGARAGALEQAVDRLHAEPRHERLVAPRARAVQLAEALAGRRPRD